MVAFSSLEESKLRGLAEAAGMQKCAACTVAEGVPAHGGIRTDVEVGASRQRIWVEARWTVRMGGRDHVVGMDPYSNLILYADAGIEQTVGSPVCTGSESTRGQ
jgi:hypothetical protein